VKKFSYLPYFFKFICSLSALFILLSACSKDPVREVRIDEDPSTATTYENGIFIVNEGNYNWGNASVTFLDNDQNIVVQDIFTKSNDRNLGDVAQSMTIIDSLGYLLINNSNRIEVVSLKKFKSVKAISGFHSPRFIRVINSRKAYVTNLQNYISILDLQTNSVTGSILTNSWTENLVLFGKYMLVASIGSFKEPSSGRNAQIIIIDTETDLIVGSIPTGKEPIGISMDKERRAWVLCSGGYDNFEAPSLLRINPESYEIEKVYTFQDSREKPSRLCINPTGDTLYFLKGGVYQMPVNAVDLPERPMIAQDGRRLYGLDVHPTTGRIYVSDAVDYVQNGTAYQYDVQGNLLKQYITGRIPGSFWFTKNSH
jgi:hypothetical protein